MTTSQGSRLTPPADVASEVELTEALVQQLLRAQHPDLADEPVARFAEGWDNVLFRIGEDWLARMPRRTVAAPLIDMELRWLPELAPQLDLAIPIPEREGEPGAGYPWRWSMSRWLAGGPAAGQQLDWPATAAALGRFLHALHHIEPDAEAPQNDHRGCHPHMRSDFLRERLERMYDIVEVDAIERAWRELTAAPDWAGRRVFCHGDLHPFNILANDGCLVAVLDWGDMHVREPAPDLAAVWMLLPPEHHAAFDRAYGDIDAATRARSRAWAIYFGVMFVHAGKEGAGADATRLGNLTLERALA